MLTSFTEVGIVTLNRPKALNALCNELIAELNDVRLIINPQGSSL